MKTTYFTARWLINSQQPTHEITIWWGCWKAKSLVTLFFLLFTFVLGHSDLLASEFYFGPAFLCLTCPDGNRWKTSICYIHCCVFQGLFTLYNCNFWCNFLTTMRVIKRYWIRNGRRSLTKPYIPELCIPSRRSCECSKQLIKMLGLPKPLVRKIIPFCLD